MAAEDITEQYSKDVAAIKTVIETAMKTKNVSGDEDFDVLNVLVEKFSVTQRKAKSDGEIYYDAYNDAGFVNLYKMVLEQMLPMKLNFEQEKYFSAFERIYTLTQIMGNAEDESPKTCESFLDTEAFKPFLGIAQTFKVPTKNEKTSNLIATWCTVIHNCLRHDERAKQAFREQDAVKLMRKWKTTGDLTMKTKANINLAYLINEKESEFVVEGDEGILKQVIQMLKDAISSPERKATIGNFKFCLEEIAGALNQLAIHDVNKGVIVENGVLPIYSKMLNTDFTQKEQLQATRGLWTLGFDDINSVIMKNDAACMKALEHHSLCSQYENVKKEAQGVLWTLKTKDADKGKVKKEKSSSTGTKDEALHVMLSYNSKSRATVLKIKERLKDAGYKVWMDVDNISTAGDSTLEAMAKAVEGAAVVLVCYSELYKISRNCRAEAEYAFKQEKHIVPIKVQNNYTPDGWLGIILGAKLWYDFSMEEIFDTSITGLLRYLAEKGGIEKQHQNVLLHNSQQVAHGVAAKPMVKWKMEEVVKWLNEIGLEDHKDKFSTVDGGVLMQMKKVHKETPVYFMKKIEGDFGLDFKDMVKFTKALDEAQ